MLYFYYFFEKLLLNKTANFPGKIEADKIFSISCKPVVATRSFTVMGSSAEYVDIFRRTVL